MGLTLGYEVVDVFTDRAFSGNPLAVVLDADDLSTGQLQAIAREFNLSETAFPMKATEGSTYRLRVFTPTTEIDFAGHPSVGSASVLHRLGRIDAGPNVQDCGAGLLPVEVTADGVTIAGGTPTLGGPLDPAPLLEALGLREDHLAGAAPRVAGVGLEWTFLQVRQDALDAAVLDNAKVVAAGSSGIALVHVDGAEVTARVFAGGVGIPEDPATGSAALALGVCLAPDLPDGTHRYVVTQGVHLGRPSSLSCTVSVVSGSATRTTVTGQTVAVARGEIAVP
ncbi:MAG: phenazine biosynthesis protein PhzF family [Frankiales bacterium]|nr:phenazine biosynthesis protein PhzF family [Frankiales bacterium]